MYKRKQLNSPTILTQTSALITFYSVNTVTLLSLYRVDNRPCPYVNHTCCENLKSQIINHQKTSFVHVTKQVGNISLTGYANGSLAQYGS